MSHGKQFTVYSHAGGPNAFKRVAIVLEELSLTYETVCLDVAKNEHKGPEFTKYNPNGRIPAIIDHRNNDYVLWESAAIMVYLVEKYDLENKISVSDQDGRFHQLQWLMFQASGQGPSFSQSGWFQIHHSEIVPSAIERYNNESRRILGVLDSVLSKQEYLVGGKATIADLSFVPMNYSVSRLLGLTFDFDKEFPNTARWHKKLLERHSVMELYGIKSTLSA